MTIPMIENWCDQCVNGVTYNVDPLVMASLVANSASGMGPFGAPGRPAGRLPALPLLPLSLIRNPERFYWSSQTTHANLTNGEIRICRLDCSRVFVLCCGIPGRFFCPVADHCAA